MIEKMNRVSITCVTASSSLNIHVIGVPEVGREIMEQKNCFFFDEILAENVPCLKKQST